MQKKEDNPVSKVSRTTTRNMKEQERKKKENIKEKKKIDYENTHLT
jgi:hypothetical protein